MTTDQTITVTVKPEIDREAVEEAARSAAALFLSSFAVAVLDGIAAAEPPEEVLARGKAETLEKAAQPSEASQGTPTAADVPEPAQTLADLTPCLGDRVRVEYLGSCIAVYGWRASRRDFGWLETGDLAGYISRPNMWTVLEHLDPVTPEEPPVGAGMLVDREGHLWRRRTTWSWHEKRVSGSWVPAREWDALVRNCGPFRPATPADLAEHGVDEQGEPVDAPKPVRQDTPPGPFLAAEVARAEARGKVAALREAAVAWSDWEALEAPETWLRDRADAIEAEAGER